MIAEAEKKQNQIKRLSQTPEGQEMIKTQNWDNAMKKASGEKIKDDPKLLKKTLKRQENKKKKSAKEWKHRLNENKDDKNGNNKRQRPGFEGKNKKFKKN